VSEARKEKSARLRRVLARYQGGRFEVGGSGGAGGMMFFRDPRGAQYYIGGFNPADAEQIAAGLNLVLELLDERPTSCNHSERENGR
jgi:hypothetical protein